MNARFVLIAIAATGLLAAAQPVFAHHSFSAEFDASQTIKLTGTVTKIDWSNPHCFFYIDVKEDAGKVTNWAWEFGSPNALIRLGWSRTSLKPGDVVTMEGTRSKDGSSLANAKTVTTLDGKRMFAGSSQGATP